MRLAPLQRGGGWKAGFSFRKAADVTAVELPAAGSTERAKAVELNREMVALSGGQLPPLARLVYLAIGGNHTNAFLRSLKGCAKADLPDLTAQGHLDPSYDSMCLPALETYKRCFGH